VTTFYAYPQSPLSGSWAPSGLAAAWRFPATSMVLLLDSGRPARGHLPREVPLGTSVSGGIRSGVLRIAMRVELHRATLERSCSPGLLRMPGVTSATGYADTHAPEPGTGAEASGALRGRSVRGVVQRVRRKQCGAKLADEFGDVGQRNPDSRRPPIVPVHHQPYPGPRNPGRRVQTGQSGFPVGAR
jgi:hypothetical protein